MRWGASLLGALIAVTASSPPPISVAGLLVAAAALGAGNLLRLLAAVSGGDGVRLRPLLLTTDILAGAAFILFSANDRYSTSYVLFALIVLEGAVLFGRVGTLVVAGSFVSVMAADYAVRDLAFGFRPEIGSVAFRVGIVLLLAALIGGITEQSRRRAQEADSRTRELEASRVRLSALAATDPLTGLPNRWSFERALERVAGPVAVLAIDVDNLKPINDGFGHEAGDMTLRAVAVALRGTLRPEDVVARVGGDEFAALLYETDLESSVAVGERIRRAMHGVAVPAGLARVSIGCAAAAVGTAVAECWNAADDALYRAKRTGRDRVVAAAGGGVLSARRRSEQALHALLKSGEVDIHYQPIVRLSDDVVVAYEALARPRGGQGMDDVGEIFAAAQRLGLHRDLDWLCRREGLRQARPLPTGSTVFVNAGTGMLLDPIHAVDQFLLLARWAGRAPEEIVVEVSEREAVGDVGHLAAVLARFRAVGIRFALDDVGDGHSTFEVVAAATPEFLKISHSLVARAHERGACAAIEAVVAFARSTGACVVAEGLESAHDVERMVAVGVDWGQGFHLAVPAPAPALAHRDLRILDLPGALVS